MDFYQISETVTVTKKNDKKEVMDIYPDFIVKRSKDLMIRGRSFYAIWDNDIQLWSTDGFEVQRLVDADLEEYRRKRKENFDGVIRLKRLGNFSTKIWSNYLSYLNQMPDNFHQLDENLTFANQSIKKTDYVSRILPYPLQEGPIDAYDELMSTLYSKEERAKLEWAVGSIVAGEAKDIQKFVVLYGEMGSGKSTFLNIVQKLFVGYYTVFDAKALTSSNNSFSTEVFRENPLVAIQHDGDLSRIEDNTLLNSIVSHEEIWVNEKFKPGYSSRMNCFLFMGTNKPVKITDAKSGVIRRLIDVKPSGCKIPTKRYHVLMSQIEFELGAIANHCLQVYRKMGRNYYSSYRPLDMILQTDVFFNYIEANYHVFKDQGGITLTQAYDIYKSYCDEALIEFKLPRHKFREEMKSYFDVFYDITRIDGKQIRSYYSGFRTDKFIQMKPTSSDLDQPLNLVLESEISLLSDYFCNCPAQLASNSDIPIRKWDEVTTVLADIDERQTHYIRPPENHIVIDFDLTDADGNKSLQLNLEKASTWPSTYAEYSKSGAGIHLHYIYDGDVTKLSHIFEDGVEIKIFTGKSSLRRRLTKCNNIPIATINSGLPMKGDKPVINHEVVRNERIIRKQIEQNLNKEIWPNTKSSVDFIYKILDEAYKSGISYDVIDLRPRVLSFAANSTNQAITCIKLVNKMRFSSEEISSQNSNYLSDDLIFFDVEVFKNLFVVVWKKKGGTKIKMINPTPQEIEKILDFKLVGFNCRRYDNHILYARYRGYTNRELFDLSQKLINGSRNAMIGEAYNISYTDVYDFASAINKKSLKKWEIELGIHHMELGLDWNEEVPEELWPKVADYCGNDVDATEATFNHLAGDWAGRQILAALSGLSVNDTTNQHTIRIVFGKEKNPQNKFNYVDLSEMFPGYIFENGVSTYKGIKVGEGGRVYAEPGMYEKVAVLDVGSQHPTSIEEMDLFGPYTKNYNDLKAGRMAIKHKDFDTLRTLLDGKLIPFIEDALGDNPKFTLKDLSTALKTALNSAYGLTFASFENPFKDPRNKDNIVAKRGALFMIDLQHAVQEKGFTVAHIKTDSIKIPHATPEIIDFVFEFGRKYGYEFEHEATYDRFCLVNDAVYIARIWWSPDPKEIGQWTATGTQFALPYVFKTLFSREPIDFKDMCETKSVTTALYLDMNEDLGSDEHNYHFVGKTGLFCPIKPGCGGGLLCRIKDNKYYAATGSKGYRWLESEMVRILGKEDDIDRSYYHELVNAAVKDISEYGDFEWFMSDDPSPIPVDYPIGINDKPPGGDNIDASFVSPPPCGNDIPCKECSMNGGCSKTGICRKEINCLHCSNESECQTLPF